MRATKLAALGLATALMGSALPALAQDAGQPGMSPSQNGSQTQPSSPGQVGKEQMHKGKATGGKMAQNQTKKGKRHMTQEKGKMSNNGMSNGKSNPGSTQPAPQ